MTDLTHAHFLLSPADELAEIEAKITLLKARAEELRLGFVTQAELPRVGQRHRVEVVTEKAEVFDPRLLPDDIRTDPRFLRKRVSKLVRTSRIDPAGEAMRAALARWEALDQASLAH